MSFTKFQIGFISLLIFISCVKKTSSDNAETASSEIPESDTVILVTKSQRKFLLIESNSNGNSMSSISITTEGFVIVNNTIDFGETDPIETSFVTDLNQDGYEELYFVTRGVGSGSYSKIYGLASNKDKSTSQIYVNEDFEDAFFEGYMGHNKYHVTNDTLSNTFPVYKSGDTNDKPTGGERTLTYELIAGEASWILKPLKINL